MSDVTDVGLQLWQPGKREENRRHQLAHVLQVSLKCPKCGGGPVEIWIAHPMEFVDGKPRAVGNGPETHQDRVENAEKKAAVLRSVLEHECPGNEKEHEQMWPPSRVCPEIAVVDAVQGRPDPVH